MRTTILLVALPLGLPFTLGLILLSRGISIIIPANIFEALLQVIAIIFGFTIVVIFSFFDKIHQFNIDFQDRSNSLAQRMRQRRSDLQKKVDPVLKKYSVIESIMQSKKVQDSLTPEVKEQLEKLTSGEGGIAESVKDMSESMNKFDGVIKSIDELTTHRHEMVKNFRIMLVLWIKLTLTIYFGAIIAAILGLMIQSNPESLTATFIVLLAIVGLLASGFLLFFYIWQSTQDSMDQKVELSGKLDEVGRFFG